MAESNHSGFKAVKELSVESANPLDEVLSNCSYPIVFRGLVSSWPVVGLAMESDVEVMRYLNRYYSGAPLTMVKGESCIHRRIDYTNDFSKINCSAYKKTLLEVFEYIESARDIGEGAPLYYVGTSSTNMFFPSFRAENDLPLGDKRSDQFIWIGNQSCIPAHFDLPNNIACNVAGRRRFTLFPPEQHENLYIGPVDFTPAGQAISLVDIRYPDFNKYPKFIEAQKHAVELVLEPGDAIFIPSMWWHHVEGLANLNILVNFWWRDVPAYLPSPMDALELTMLSLNALDQTEKDIWRKLFESYVFNSDSSHFEHIPEGARGILGKPNELLARKLRSKLVSKLNK